MELSQEISYVHSPTCSTTQISMTSSTEEDDDDMAASCLILLAQGGCPVKQLGGGAGKMSSRKFSEMATTAAGAAKAAAAAGLYVYECKTCNRTFPSFQALGGHRASHKKPKLMDHDHHHHQIQDHHDVKKQSPPPPPPPSAAGESNKAKIHECSICRAEFSSGQALGGHMRRHRPPPPINTATPAKASVSNSIDEATESSEVDCGDNPRAAAAAVFSLDLNLPAPQEEEEGGNKFEFSAKQQQSLVFSVPALVDCHY